VLRVESDELGEQDVLYMIELVIDGVSVYETAAFGSVSMQIDIERNATPRRIDQC
jgi:hypothetical protein